MKVNEDLIKAISWIPYVIAFGLLLLIFHSEALHGYADKSFLISLIAFVMLMVFAIKFEDVSLFKILELKKRIKEEKATREKVEEKNYDLTKHLVSLSLSLKQSQSNITLNTPIDGATLQSLLGVTRADEQDIEKKKAEEEPPATVRTEAVDYRSRIEERKQLEERIVNEKLSGKMFAQKEVKFTSAMNFIDPITSNRNIIFDGFYVENGVEVFVEVMPNRSLSFSLADRLYMQLNHIYLYNKAASKNAYLEVTIYEQPEAITNESPTRRNTLDMLNRYFEPALKSGLLKLHQYTENRQT